MILRLLVLAPLLGLAGCDLIAPRACTSELVPNLAVEVRTAATGAPAARGATGVAIHEGGRATELTSFRDSLRLDGNWAGEQPGGYEVVVRKPGYRRARVETTVEEGDCHVKTRKVPVSLEVDEAAQVVTPVEASFGEHLPGDPASVTVRARGDLIEIVGAAPAPCRRLRAVAVRSGDQWHVQLEPEEWPQSCTTRPRLQRFKLTYRMIPGHNWVLVTSALGFPAELFEGRVAPD